MQGLAPIASFRPIADNGTGSISYNKTRLSAIALAIYSVATGIIFHNFWASPADQVIVQQVMFLKNLSIAGGLLLLSTGGIGSWAIDHQR